MKKALILFTLFSTALHAQYEGVYSIPLPEELVSRENSVTLYNTPHPNYAEFEDESQTAIVWKHSTVIRANEDLTITETGAYLLRNGEWWKRASFSPKETKKMFATKTLELKANDSIVFQDNWRFGNTTTTGWNFWYVKAINENGEELFGYDILETKGEFIDHTQVLPLIGPKSSLNWTGAAGDSDYALSGEILALNGTFQVQEDQFQRIRLEFQMESLSHEIESLVKHLKSSDFFHVKKYPNATFNSEEITLMPDNTYLFKGELCLKGTCRNETFKTNIISTKETYEVQFSAQIDRTNYGVNYASSKEPSNEYSISDDIEFSGSFFFQKDYPGSVSWNTIDKK